MKNKNATVFIIVGLVALIAVGAFIFFNKKAAPVPVAQTPSEETVSAIKPEEVGLSLTASSDNKKVILEVKNTKGISKLEYELSYVKKGDIPVGVIGQPAIKSEGQIVKQEITLGTCSDVCHYDEGVSSVKLVLKITKTNGTVVQTEKSLDLK